jgi:hypothetical protein
MMVLQAQSVGEELTPVRTRVSHTIMVEPAVLAAAITREVKAETGTGAAFCCVLGGLEMRATALFFVKAQAELGAMKWTLPTPAITEVRAHTEEMAPAVETTMTGHLAGGRKRRGEMVSEERPDAVVVAVAVVYIRSCRV